MKKVNIILLIIFLVLSMEMPVMASENFTMVGEGYDANGIYYSAYKIMESNLESELDEIVTYGSSIRVEKEITFQGNIMPPATHFFRVQINGDYYSGTLSLANFYYASSYTIATYQGILIRE